MRHLKIKISGKVQGVFFRDSVGQKGEEWGIKGFVRNEPDGLVYIEAEGPEEVLEKLVNWCWEGPDMAKVDKVEIEEGDIKNFEDFQVR
ncbi:MAG: acylphosphatase [bacterium]|nr:acylphosphatase [bacterium]